MAEVMEELKAVEVPPLCVSFQQLVPPGSATQAPHAWGWPRRARAWPHSTRTLREGRPVSPCPSQATRRPLLGQRHWAREPRGPGLAAHPAECRGGLMRSRGADVPHPRHSSAGGGGASSADTPGALRLACSRLVLLQAAGLPRSPRQSVGEGAGRPSHRRRACDTCTSHPRPHRPRCAQPGPWVSARAPPGTGRAELAAGGAPRTDPGLSSCPARLGGQVFLKSDSLCLMEGRRSRAPPTLPSARLLAMHIQQLETGGFTMTNGAHRWSKLR